MKKNMALPVTRTPISGYLKVSNDSVFRAWILFMTVIKRRVSRKFVLK